MVSLGPIEWPEGTTFPRAPLGSVNVIDCQDEFLDLRNWPVTGPKEEAAYVFIRCGVLFPDLNRTLTTLEWNIDTSINFPCDVRFPAVLVSVHLLIAQVPICWGSRFGHDRGTRARYLGHYKGNTANHWAVYRKHLWRLCRSPGRTSLGTTLWFLMCCPRSWATAAPTASTRQRGATLPRILMTSTAETRRPAVACSSLLPLCSMIEGSRAPGLSGGNME